ncbi:hypothetical protein DFP72DRAFT_1177475 [Ephemerocybe angulata]|uniref:Uncharacterized protein n=1 Tax=Ephemerocybe angulata TaxID=980116 RepID=A0A8H6HCW9_9AGAR|nr:hypothetical protein DFP72DRAFT_1177475 [Tulosesus angulatus]
MQELHCLVHPPFSSLSSGLVLPNPDKMKSFALFTTFFLLAASPIIVLARHITFSNDPSELSSRDEADPIYDVSARDLKLVDFLVREVDFDALIERRGAKNAKRPNNKPKKAPKAPAKPQLKRTANFKRKGQGKPSPVQAKLLPKAVHALPPHQQDLQALPPHHQALRTLPPRHQALQSHPLYHQAAQSLQHGHRLRDMIPDIRASFTRMLAKGYYPPARTDSSPTLGRPPTPKPGVGKRIVNWGKGVWNRGKRN